MTAMVACVPAPGRAGEDHGVLGPDVAVVVDGVGLPSGGCRHGVAWYARQHATATLAAVADGDLADGLAVAIDTVATRHPECDLADPATPSAAVGIVRLTQDRVEALSLADVTIAVDLGAEVRTVVDRHAEARAGLVAAGLTGHAIGTPAHAAAVAGLVAERATACNQQDGFWVAAADPGAAYRATTVTLDRTGVRGVAVCSDGASWPADDGVWSWREYLDLLAGHGPAALIEAVRDLENGDPDGLAHPRLKRHDDATVAFLC